MPTVTWANWQVNWDLDTTDNSGLRIGNCHFNGTQVLAGAGQPFTLVPYHGDSPVFKDGIKHQGAPYTPIKKTAPNVGNSVLYLWSPGSNFADFVQIDQNAATSIEPAHIDIWAKFDSANYQYIHRWKFMADGSIHPQVGLGGRLHHENPPDVTSHIHHFYFRLDFDIDGAADDVVERFSHQGNQGGRDKWSPILVESKEIIDPVTFTKWRVRNKKPKDAGTPNERYLSYEISPGSDAGRDGYSTGDLWVVRYFDGWGKEVVTTDSALEAPPYMSGDATDGQDLVIWYALHAHHEVRLKPGEETLVVPYHFIEFHIQPRNFLAETPIHLYATNPVSPDPVLPNS